MDFATVPVGVKRMCVPVSRPKELVEASAIQESQEKSKKNVAMESIYQTIEVQKIQAYLLKLLKARLLLPKLRNEKLLEENLI